MHRDAANTAEHNLVVVFIVSAFADVTAGLFLCYLGLHGWVNSRLYVVSLLRNALVSLHLRQDLSIPLVILSLLREFKFLKEVSLKLAGVVDIHDKFVHVFFVPLPVFDHILDKSRVYPVNEALAILLHLLRPVDVVVEVVWVVWIHLKGLLEL